MTEVSCRCCGVGLEGERVKVRRCVVCDLCDRKHGDELELHVTALVRSRQISMWHGIARMLVDDANIAGMLSILAVEDDGGIVSAYPLVMGFVPRWRVVIGRALARDEAPDITRVVGAVLARHLPARNSQALRDAIARDTTDALRMVDPFVIDVEVRCDQDFADPEHLIFTVNARAAALGQTVVASADVEIPDSVMRGPRGQA